MRKLTLHEAMVVVLRHHGGGWMNRDDIAAEIATQGLFLRPSDGQPPPSDQLRLRARKYQTLFECSDTACTRIRLRESAAAEAVIENKVPREPVMTGKPSTFDAAHASRRRLEAAGRFRPAKVRLLLVAESPPQSLDRYFYFEDVQTQDSLFRYVVRTVLDIEPSRDAKAAMLMRLRDLGVFLIDLKPKPSDPRPLHDHVPDLVVRIGDLASEAVILIKATVYDAAFSVLKQEGLPVIDERVPFPGSGQQKRFHEAMTRALASASFHPT